jgi:hypothetical protein
VRRECIASLGAVLRVTLKAEQMYPVTCNGLAGPQQSDVAVTTFKVCTALAAVHGVALSAHRITCAPVDGLGRRCGQKDQAHDATGQKGK